MLKKKACKIFIFFMVLVTMLNVSVCFEDLDNGHFLQLNKVDAATEYTTLTKSSDGSTIQIPVLTYTADTNGDSVGDTLYKYVEITDSGTWTPPNVKVVDVFMIGGGAAGGTGRTEVGRGGGSGYSTTKYNVNIGLSAQINIGHGGYSRCLGNMGAGYIAPIGGTTSLYSNGNSIEAAGGGKPNSYGCGNDGGSLGGLGFYTRYTGTPGSAGEAAKATDFLGRKHGGGGGSGGYGGKGGTGGESSFTAGSGGLADQSAYDAYYITEHIYASGTGGGGYGGGGGGSDILADHGLGGQGGQGFCMIRWIENKAPSILSFSPSQNETLSNDNSCIPSMTVSDPNGNELSCKYYIDSVEKKIITAFNTASGQTVNFNALDISTISEGNHIFRFEVSDGIATPISQSVDVIVDNQPPVISGEDFTSDDTSITISGSATDTISDAGSLQYQFTVGNNVLGWSSATSNRVGSLQPDTEYTAKFEVKDKVGHIASIEKTIRTKAQAPQISVNKDNIQKDRMELIINDTNPSETEYQIQTGSSYVTANGVLTPSPEWIKVTSKRITVSGLSSNTPYTFTAKAKNSVGTGQATGTTLALPPPNIALVKGINSIKVTWDAVSNATGYYVVADGKQPVDVGLSTEYTHSGLIAETNHSYKVSVRNSGGTGPYSFPDLIGMTLPNPPEAPVITDTSTTYTAITINWDEVATADGYEIEADGKIIPTDSNTMYKKSTYTDEGLQPDSLHKYRVRSKNTGGPSDWSTVTEISTMPTPPEIPENLEGMPSRTNITLTWNAAPRAEKYVIDLDGKSLEVGSVTSHVHEGLSPNTTYTYKIKAWNKGGESKWSSTETITTWPEIPVAPTNIMATAERDAITVTWYSTPFAESYDLQIDGNEIVNVKETSFTDKGLAAGTKHTYRILSRNISGAGKWSNLLEISTLPKADITTTEATLANIVAVVTNKAVTLAWQAVAVNAQYEVEVDGILSDNGKETVYNHTGLKPLTFHTYRIRTKDANGNGQWCAVLALSTLPNIPGAPSGVNAIAANTQIELRWNKEDETGYDVEVDGKVVDAGVAAKYIDDELNPGTAHTYRVRGKNITGVTAWSDSITKSTISPAYEVDCIKGQEFKFSLLASNVQEFGEMTFVVTYNPEDIEVEDLCEYTVAKDVIDSGMIPGTNITVKYTAGRIEFTVNESIIAGTTWSGEITTILFKPKLDGKTSIEFNIE